MDRNELKDYNAFIVNRGLSYFNDCVPYVNEMNKFHFLDKDIQYTFLYKTIKKGKRFSKWIKKDESDILADVCNYYKVNNKTGLEMIELLDQKQKDRISEIMSFGGKTK